VTQGEKLIEKLDKEWRRSSPSTPTRSTTAATDSCQTTKWSSNEDLCTWALVQFSNGTARWHNDVHHTWSQYNIITGQIASDDINVADTLSIGERMKTDLISSLPEGFHESISSPVKTMEAMKKGVKVGSSMVYDMETIFLRLLMLGQARQMELAPIFQFELCAVPRRWSTSMDAFGREQSW
jgi:hypothetical protein